MSSVQMHHHATRFSVLFLFALLALGAGIRFGTGRSGDAAARDSRAARPSDPEADGQAGPSSRSGARRDDTVATLRSLVSHAASLRNGFDPDVLNRIRAKLDALEPDELLALLRELDASDSPRKEKMSLEGLFFGSLARRDPALALDTFAGRISGRFVEVKLRELQFTYERWLSQDLATATEWLEQRTAEGRFDQGQLRSRLELSLLRALASRDAGAAAARFVALDGEGRKAALQGDWFPPMPEEREKAVADFLREHTGDSAADLAQAASARLGKGSLGDVAAFLDRIDPPPEERAAMVAEALRSRLVNRYELLVTPEEARHWIREQAPDAADRLSGVALARFVEWHSFSGMAELALTYRDESGSDEALAAFLKEAPASHRREILELAGEISDPVRREDILSRFSEASTPSPESP